MVAGYHWGIPDVWLFCLDIRHIGKPIQEGPGSKWHIPFLVFVMGFNYKKSLEILYRTPDVLEQLLSGLSLDWYSHNEGENTWSPYDILGHLIHGEKTDWLERTEIILSTAADKTFIPFDRFAQMGGSNEKPMATLLQEFRELRFANLAKLKLLQIADKDLEKTGIHPELGEVSLQQLLASWVVHDLGHIAQISRVMAKQYKEEVGPWIAYLGILSS